jgi:hypothetical protein
MRRGQIGVFAGVDRSDAMMWADLLRAVQRAELRASSSDNPPRYVRHLVEDGAPARQVGLTE